MPKEGTISVVDKGVDAFGHARLGGIGQQVAEAIEERTGSRPGSPFSATSSGVERRPAFDRVLSTRFGIAAIDAVHDGGFGQMVALRGDGIVRVPLSAAVAELKTIDHELVEIAEVFFG